MELYLNNTSIKNNKYFKTHEELLNLSVQELEEIKAYKKKAGLKIPMLYPCLPIKLMETVPSIKGIVWIPVWATWNWWQTVNVTTGTIKSKSE